MSGIDFFRRLETIKDRIEYAPQGEPSMGQEDLWWAIAQIERLIQPKLPLFSMTPDEPIECSYCAQGFVCDCGAAASEMQARISNQPFWGS